MIDDETDRDDDALRAEEELATARERIAELETLLAAASGGRGHRDEVGSCRRCGRLLFDPASQALRLGFDCFRRVVTMRGRRAPVDDGQLALDFDCEAMEIAAVPTASTSPRRPSKPPRTSAASPRAPAGS